MKESRLGEFEELIMLIVGILDNEAYALNISEEFELQTKKSTAIGAVHSTLSRLEDKGFLTSEMGGATSERGGRRKRIYSITAAGQKVLERSRELRISLWDQFPAFAEGKMKFILV